MDVNETPVWPILVADWLDRAVSLWHEHRTLVLSLGLICLVVLRLYFKSLGQVVRPNSGPSLPLPPALNHDEKAIWSSKALQGDLQKLEVNGKAHSQRASGPKLVAGRRPQKSTNNSTLQQKGQTTQIQPIVFYCSLTGTTAQLAETVVSQLKANSSPDGPILPPSLHDVSYVDLDDYFTTGPKSDNLLSDVKCFYILLIPSYNIDTILTNFLSHLNETHHDFRIDTAPLSSLSGYSVFGVGDKEGWPTEAEGFCSQAIEVDKWMAKLTSRKRAYPMGLGDVKSDYKSSLLEWVAGVRNAMEDLSINGNLGEGVQGSGADIESGDEEVAEFPDSGRRKRQKFSQVADLEDVRGPPSGPSSKNPLPIDFTTTSNSSSNPPSAFKAMVPTTSPTYASLTKQGYTIIGTHSGVKICRWTKSALRGRGSCYKNSFYGIKSHLCMETTPSLSCSNKCVFCWRHGTNPVSTTWRWQVDDPQMIFDGAREGHLKKIKMMKGVPGVRAERFEEAMRIRHCALSLVGEPIFYPRINEFVGLLHDARISSFLVCNAQHPDQLQRLRRVTQLYVSIDASNRDSLRRIDRPLHRDFWERFQACLDIIREKRFVQRTVYRLTLVKGFNVDDEVEGYADLVQQGSPCFVEVKGVTYCGTSTSAGVGLTMQNVPWYEEIVVFVEALNRALEKRGLEYGLAAEHVHSCCVLLASKRFFIRDKWHTVIDYERFFELLGKEEPFTPEDYCLPTPGWALWGKGGFDPADVRVDRKGKPKVITAAT